MKDDWWAALALVAAMIVMIPREDPTWWVLADIVVAGLLCRWSIFMLKGKP